MHGFLRQATAATVLAGPFLATTDRVTPLAALAAPAAAAAGATAGAALAKAGAAAGYAPQGWAHDRLGYYAVALAATDTDTVGTLTLEFVDPAGYAPVRMDYVVLPAAAYDALFVDGLATAAQAQAIAARTNLLPDHPAAVGDPMTLQPSTGTTDTTVETGVATLLNRIPQVVSLAADGTVNVNLEQKLSPPRLLDGVADVDLAVNDALHCAAAAAAGGEDAATFPAFVVRTVGGFALRNFTLGGTAQAPNRRS